MKLRRRLIGCALMTLLSLPRFAFAALDLSTDNRSLSFGLMQLSEQQTLAQYGTYHNEVTCSSTNGITWYVKINLLQPLSSGGESIPIERFQWELVSTSGTGTIAHTGQFTPFSLTPDLVYLSGANEASGEPVRLRFRYSLNIPDAQVHGVYSTTVRFTLTEIL